MSKKSSFNTLAKGLLMQGLKKVNLPVPNLDVRKLSIDEIKEYLQEAYKKAKKDKVECKAKEVPGGWGDTELENQIDWMKNLNIKEFFEKKSK